MSRPSTNNTKVSFFLDGDIVNRIKDIAKKNNTTSSNIMRHIIEDFFSRDNQSNSNGKEDKMNDIIRKLDYVITGVDELKGKL